MASLIPRILVSDLVLSLGLREWRWTILNQQWIISRYGKRRCCINMKSATLCKYINESELFSFAFFYTKI